MASPITLPTGRAKCGKSLRASAVKEGKAVRLVHKAIRNAKLSPEQIDYVLMAGNSTTVPLVQQVLEDLFGPEKILRKVHPKHSVAMGAAIVAAMIGNRVVCQAPDPSDSKRECGHVNVPDALVCANCGVSLQLEPAAPGQPAAAGPGIFLSDLKRGVAPFHYGTQSAGDKFNVLIHNGDPYPTEDPQPQSFPTPFPNQRMISIPVYGGDNLEKASANEKQGEAFAILPLGLPQGTSVRLRLWLNSNGIFELTAHLENGTDLKPWIVEKGEANEKAIRAIEGRAVARAKGRCHRPDDRKKVESARSRVFEKMCNKDFDGALQDAENLVKMVEGMGVGMGRRI